MPINNCKNNLVFDEFYEEEFKVFSNIIYVKIGCLQREAEKYRDVLIFRKYRKKRLE